MAHMTNFKISKILQAKLALFQKQFPKEQVVNIIENQGKEHYILDINNNC